MAAEGEEGEEGQEEGQEEICIRAVSAAGGAQILTAVTPVHHALPVCCPLMCDRPRLLALG